MLNKQEIDRYTRQIQLSEFGIAAQEKLKAANILVIGAGGLGCPALQYLTAMGVGNIGIMDGDTVSESNLHRQILYTSADIGKNKVECAVQKLSRLNSYTKFVTYNFHITNKNALDIIAKYDVIVDGTDNYLARYIINDACVILNKPLVFAALYKFEGQLTVFNYVNNNSNPFNYRDLFPKPPAPEESPNCNDIGVLGILPGIAGTLQANEVIKIITGIGNVLSGKLLLFNVLNVQFATLGINKIKNDFQFTKEYFLNYNYQHFCNIEKEIRVKEISQTEFNSILKSERSSVQIIDVREMNEFPELPKEMYDKKIPLAEIIDKFDEINTNKRVILICKSGIRSKIAAQMLQKKIGYNNIYSLKDGIDNWKLK